MSDTEYADPDEEAEDPPTVEERLAALEARFQTVNGETVMKVVGPQGPAGMTGKCECAARVAELERRVAELEGNPTE